jgi:hypothetical protein
MSGIHFSDAKSGTSASTARPSQSGDRSVIVPAFMRGQTVDDADRSAFYRTALLCLRFLEQRSPTGRRFGPDADARWSSFRGDLETSDRIDLLLRDADSEWPRAFAARVVFRLQGIADDEPFGPEWPGLTAVRGEDLWRGLAGEPLPSDLTTLLDRLAAAWDRPLQRPALPPIRPTTHLLLAGPGAIAATAEHFARATDLAWSDQVLVLARTPFERQLAALMGALLNSRLPTRLLADDEPTPSDFPVDHRVVSADADPLTATRAQSLGVPA